MAGANGKGRHLSASLEDYLEAILVVSKDSGEARSKGIMEHLDVSGPSVTEALQQLNERGMVNYTPYEPIRLTPKGKEIAEDILYRHETLHDFFVEVLGVESSIADEGACKMEHVASSNIISRMVLYTRYLKEKGSHELCGDQGMHCFQEYLKTTGDLRQAEEF